MTERVQPGAMGSRYRGIEMGEATGAGGNYIVDADNPTVSSIRYGTLDHTAYAEFDADWSDTSLDVTIQPGEAFLDAWLAKDEPTTVSLEPSTTDQTVVLGWDPDAVYDSATDESRDAADSVLLDTEANVEELSQEKPYVQIWEFDTDEDGVTAARDVRGTPTTPGNFTDLHANTLDTPEQQGAVAIGPVETSASAGGDDAVAIGNDAEASDSRAIALGLDTTASDFGAIALGQNAEASGDDNATALGQGAEASGSRATALGLMAEASASRATALGRNAEASGSNSTALGRDATAGPDSSIAIGYSAEASETSDGAGTIAIGEDAFAESTSGTDNAAIAIGQESLAEGGFSQLAIGQNAEASASNATALGRGATASASRATALGRDATASDFDATALGQDATASEDSATALGLDAEASGFAATALGRGTTASDFAAIALGRNTTAGPESSIAIGDSAEASETDDGAGTIAIGQDAFAESTSGVGSTAIAIGKNAVADSGVYQLAIGEDAEASDGSATALGRLATASGINSTALGRSAEASESDSTAVGRDAEASASSSTALGRDAEASDSRATALGYDVTVSNSDATAIGRSATASGINATALGRTAEASGSSSTALGPVAESSGDNSVALGRNAEALSNDEGVLGVDSSTSGPSEWKVPGSLEVGEALEAKIEETSFNPYQVGPHIIDRTNTAGYSSIGVVNLSNEDMAHYTIYFQVQPDSNARWEMTLYNDGEVVSDAAAYSIFGLATNSSTIETDSQEEATTIPLSTISDSHNNTPTIAKLDVYPNEGNVDWTFRNPLPSGEPSTGSRSENGRGTVNARQRIDAIEFQNSSGTGVRGSGTNTVILSANGKDVNNNESITEGV